MYALLLACSEPSPVDDAKGGEDGTTSPVDDGAVTWEGLPDEEPLPMLLDADGVAGALDEGFARLVGMDAGRLDENIAATWARLDRDGPCPEYYGANIGSDYTYEDWWSGGCVDPDGTAVDGYGQRTTASWGGEGSAGSYATGYFEGTITSPEGWKAGGFGYYYLEEARDTDGQSVWRYLIGELSAEAADTDGSWLERSAGYAMSGGAWWDRWGGVWMAVDGNVPLEGDAVAFSVLGVEAYSTSWGYPCPGEYAGTWSVRDANGWWYVVDFDADEYETDGTCDGCAEVLVDGVSIGTACPDLEPMISMEVIAW